MNIQNLLLSCLLVSTFTAATAAEDVVMKAEKAVVITFDSQSQRTYKLLGAQSAAGQWDTLKGGFVGTGPSRNRNCNGLLRSHWQRERHRQCRD